MNGVLFLFEKTMVELKIGRDANPDIIVREGRVNEIRRLEWRKRRGSKKIQDIGKESE